MNSAKRSRFAGSLRNLLEHPGGYSKQEWARVLGVTPSAISNWLGDKNVPRPSTLRSIIEITTLRYGPEFVSNFLAIASLPARSVSPLGERMAPTVAHYMVEPLRDGFLRILQTVPPTKQEEVLLDGAEQCLSHLRHQAAQTVSPMKTASILRQSFSDAHGASIERLNQAKALRPISGSDRLTLEEISE